ncbi:M48 family metallopeptidase [bacterium]|nr:M48 family metallopeptidase [bacterium]
MEKFIIDNLEVCYTSIYRNIKIPRIKFAYGVLTLILPCHQYSKKEELLQRHSRWIKNRYLLFKEIEAISKQIVIYPIEENDFKLFVINKIEEFSKELNVETKKIIFKKLKSRWGSCTNEGAITINLFLRFLPENLTEYVVFHEVAHLLEHRHNKTFYNIIDQKFFNKEKIEKRLSAYWYLLFSKSFNTKNLKKHHEK